ncbi:transporter substrate-binding domain-containing protein [Thalassotalea profundi]|uniref:Solute-binding protein family 3/N-terminal domain-containing protein n=1 Tax=Thalassotalea profundi TaxID=2036687 RepID=A0ABQ3IK80_9GAMM|nr:transporter substrate-binding domain-containing protein [Thalassotalea profundi]GHE84324.1 hypothetical protein GCM10011501_11250 [Thalassotalea profundi]
MYIASLKILLLVLSLLCSKAIHAKENVEFYIYIDKPPFIINKEKEIGLSYDFFNALNEYSDKFNYVLKYVPKLRAITFSKSQSGVLWTTPFWVGDENLVKFDWISNLMSDRELYITNDSELTYEGIESLYGKELVGVRGFTYFNLEAAFNDKKITRVDVHNETIIPLMLLNNRADVGVIGLHAYNYLKNTMPEVKNKLYILEGYQKEFFRSILIDKSKPELKVDIENWFKSEEGKAKWLEIKAKWLVNF